MKAQIAFAEIQRIHRKWTDDDLFRVVPDRVDARPGSIRQFIHEISLGNFILRASGQSEQATFPDLTNLHQTFGEFVADSVRNKTGDLVSVRSIVYEVFCTSLIIDLASEVMRTCRDDRVQTALFEEFGVNHWSDWMAAVNQEGVSHQLASALLDNLLARLKDRTLYSFFVREAAGNGFINWDASVKSDAGRRLKPHQIEDKGRTVVVKVNRYPALDGDDPIAAYEWNAELNGLETSAPDAIACGMVYVFERDKGSPIGDRSDLLQIADSVADTDVLQVNSFFRQHEDADSIIEDSDLCFVWLWERRAGAEPGLGARCLKAAIMDLQHRFKMVHTAIIDTRPAQFVSWSMPKDPPMVQVAKQTAIEQLTAYLESITIPNVEVRHIFNHMADDPLAALVAIGSDDIEQLAMHDETHVPPNFEWSDNAEELAAVFQRAGLDDLSCAVDEGYATCFEIVQALKHLIFHQRIPFLPASISVGIDYDELFHTAGVPHHEALEDLSVDYFVSCLPDGVTFRHAYWQEMDDDGVPSWIIMVTANTKFCELSEYYTLIPVPRPMDVSHLIEPRRNASGSSK